MRFLFSVLIIKHQQSTHIGWGRGDFVAATAVVEIAALAPFSSEAAAFLAADNFSAGNEKKTMYEICCVTYGTYLPAVNRQHPEWSVDSGWPGHCLIEQGLARSSIDVNEWSEMTRTEQRFQVTLLFFDPFFDDTEVHFSSSLRFFGCTGVVSTEVMLVADFGGDVLLTFSVSDVRALQEGRYWLPTFDRQLSVHYLFCCFLFCCDCCFFVAHAVDSSISIVKCSNSSRSVGTSSKDGQSLYGVIMR